MNDLSAFIREQLDAREREIDEDERVARAASVGPWRYNPDKHHREPGTVRFSEGVFSGAAGRDAICVATTGETDDPQSMADAEHMARWDPQSILADIRAQRRDLQAKRLILAWCDRLDPGYGLGGLITPDAREIRKLLAVMFADEPSYRAEWVPHQRPATAIEPAAQNVPYNEFVELPADGTDQP